MAEIIPDGQLTQPVIAGGTLAEPIYPDLIKPPGTETVTSDQEEDKANKDGEDIYQMNLVPGVDDVSTIPNDDEYKKRQQLFNPKEHKDAVKEVKGNPSNNNDPYPIDLKIVEMEAHQPRVVIYPPISADEIAQKLIDLSVNSEKRISQLENVVSVLSRYLFRLSSRLPINCVYYGGQNSYGKYDCIRCLHADRINDGQLMTLDQCLNCTRYEPIIGQVYDILNENGQNLAVILDDLQMGYTSMKEYIDMSRLEEQPTETSMANLKQEAEEPEAFSEVWDQGFIMDWNETPVESQVPLINSYQYGDGPLYDSSSIIAEGMRNAQLDSGMYAMEFDSSSALNPEYHGAVTSTDPYIQKCIDAAIKRAKGAAPVTVQNMIAGGYKDALVKASLSAGVDPLLTLAIIAIESNGRPGAKNPSGANGLMQVIGGSMDPETNITQGLSTLNRKKKVIKSNTLLFIITAYGCGEGIVLGSKGKPSCPKNYSQVRDTDYKWCDYVLQLKAHLETYWPSYNVDEKTQHFPKIMYAYQFLKQELEKQGIVLYQPPGGAVSEGGTAYDSVFRLPFEAADVHDLYFTSDFGYRIHPTLKTRRFHDGVDLAPTKARLAKGDVYILAAADGTVTAASFVESVGWYIRIQHANGCLTVYCHLKERSLLVKVGDQVQRGQKIACCGNTGAYTTGTHLHFGVKTVKGNDPLDPKAYLRGLGSRLNKSL